MGAMAMGSVLNPRGIKLGGVLTTVTGGADWNVVLDCTAATDDANRFENHGWQVINLDSSIVIEISLDGGRTVWNELTPGVNFGEIHDSFKLPEGKVWERHASGTPKMMVGAWA